MTIPPVPTDWTPDQACAVIDFLHALAAAIWDEYDDAIAFMQRLEPPYDDAFPDHDQPFDDESPV